MIQKDVNKAESSNAKRVKKLFHRFKVKADFTKDPKLLSLLFQKLLFRCNDYVNASHGLDQELPPIHFHVAGGNGNKQTLSLMGGDYAYETMKDDIHYVKKNLYGIFPTKVRVNKGEKRFCAPAFSQMAYNTTLNGPTWLFGLPFFYKFQVGYETKKPAVSFSEGPCGSCSADGQVQKSPVVLSSTSSESSGESSIRIRQPRLVRGPHRLPKIDVNEPL